MWVVGKGVALASVERVMARLGGRVMAEGAVRRGAFSLALPVDFDKFVEAVAKLGLYWLAFNEPAPDLPAPGAPE